MMTVWINPVVSMSMSKDRDPSITDLSRYLNDAAAARAVRAWANDQKKRVEIPDRPWRRTGGSGAVLARVRIVPLALTSDPFDVLLKVCSPGSPAHEPANHEQVWERTPLFADRHLFRQAFASTDLDDGRVLMFLDSSETLSNSRTLGEMPSAPRLRAAAVTTSMVLFEWNSPATWYRRKMAADSFLRLELRGAMDQGRSACRWAEDAGVLDRRVDWVETATGSERFAPNPVRLTEIGSIAGKHEVDYLSGNAHGDLHADNVIVPRAADKSWDYPRIRLIDLSGFDPSAPLSRDVATLLLSLILPAVRAGLSEAEARTLVHLLTTPEPEGTESELPVAARLVQAVRCAAVAGFNAGLRQVFHTQYLLSLIAQTIIYTSYSNVGAAGQHWYFALGAHAANEFLKAKA